MRTWIVNLWDRLRNSMWVIPSIGLMTAIASAAAMISIDASLRIERYAYLSWATTTAPAARATMSTLAGSLVTVTSVVFSMTMLTLSQTSSMYGSRLLRSLLNSNVTQATLATFLGTSLYCFVILWAIREFDSRSIFVPHLGVGVGLFAGVTSFAVFVYFINHVTEAIQAQAIVRDVAQELNQSIDRLFPDELGHLPESYAGPSVAIAESKPGDVAIIDSDADGYVQGLDIDTLLSIACEQKLIVRLQCQPGDFVGVGIPIAAISPSEFAPKTVRQINNCVLTGWQRTPRQDVECSIFELVEVAVRALSPGINDPRTAISCVNYLGAAMMKLSQRRMPSMSYADHDGTIRVLAQPISFSDALNASFDEIRRHARSSASVTLCLAESLHDISQKVKRAGDRTALIRLTEMLERGCESGIPEENDRKEIFRVLDRVRKHLSS